jgi:hypothetical protein
MGGIHVSGARSQMETELTVVLAGSCSTHHGWNSLLVADTERSLMYGSVLPSIARLAVQFSEEELCRTAPNGATLRDRESLKK